MGFTVCQEVCSCLGDFHPVHAGFHFQLFDGLPGLRDASGAIIGHAFFHSAVPAERRHSDRPGKVAGWGHQQLAMVR